MESDFQYALLIQKQLEQEVQSSPRSTMYSSAENKENQYDNLIVKRNNEKYSLIDPSWELIDPTPNIYALFVQFDKVFFWNQLNAVILKWSKRMTSCAGICSYAGRRSGECTISLSEPLLKLRPRKDLVETLLHEMIHAYLFVTHNNRDRDGHGPEFHKHMYRINGQAGTNISVYHDFHDEVKLYQTHWWRCDGPCQHRGPFYGMVKRATNRAPGPNDRWWTEHQHNCGGKFIKIKGPEQKTQPSKVSPTKSGADIRNFFTPPSNSQMKVPQIISDVNSGTSSGSKTPKTSGVAQIKTINDVKSTPGRGGGMRMNKGGVTVVVNNTKNGTKIENETVNLRIDNFQPFSGSGFSLQTSSTPIPHASTSGINPQPAGNTPNYNTIRSRWLNWHNEQKRHQSEHSSTPVNKIPKCSTDPEELANCPICSKSIDAKEINAHLDECLEISFNNDFDELVEEDDESAKSPTKKQVNCLVCNKLIAESMLNGHLEQCMSNVFNDDLTDVTNGNLSDVINDSDVILQEVEPELIVLTDDESNATNVTQEVLHTLNNEDELVSCPCCPVMVRSSEINAHLDQCLNSS